MSGAGSRFVAVPADALIAELDAIGTAVATIQPRPGRVAGGLSWSTASAGRERVCTILLPGHEDARPAIRVFTSLAARAEMVRGCGEDAVRIVIGIQRPVPAVLIPDASPYECANATRGGFWPLQDEATRVFRTAPRGEESERVTAFLLRLRTRLRDVYAEAQRLPRCPVCGRVMRERKSDRGSFLGCSGFPECRGTMSLPARSA